MYSGQRKISLAAQKYLDSFNENAEEKRKARVSFNTEPSVDIKAQFQGDKPRMGVKKHARKEEVTNLLIKSKPLNRKPNSAEKEAALSKLPSIDSERPNDTKWSELRNTMGESLKRRTEYPISKTPTDNLKNVIFSFPTSVSAPPKKEISIVPVEVESSADSFAFEDEVEEEIEEMIRKGKEEESNIKSQPLNKKSSKKDKASKRKLSTDSSSISTPQSSSVTTNTSSEESSSDSSKDTSDSSKSSTDSSQNSSHSSKSSSHSSKRSTHSKKDRRKESSRSSNSSNLQTLAYASSFHSSTSLDSTSTPRVFSVKNNTSSDEIRQLERSSKESLKIRTTISSSRPVKVPKSVSNENAYRESSPIPLEAQVGRSPQTPRVEMRQRKSKCVETQTSERMIICAETQTSQKARERSKSAETQTIQEWREKKRSLDTHTKNMEVEIEDDGKHLKNSLAQRQWKKSMREREFEVERMRMRLKELMREEAEALERLAEQEINLIADFTCFINSIDNSRSIFLLQR